MSARKHAAAKRNAAGNYVYFCADCGRECTVGTPGAPAHADVDGVTRCWKCDRAADAKRIALTARKGEKLRNALDDAALFVERMRKKGRVPKDEAADLLNTLADAGALLGLNLPRPA